MRTLAWSLAALAALSFLAIAAQPTDAVAICVAGNVYNTGGSPCEGVVCTGWSMGQWQTCYPDLGPCPEGCPPPPY